MTTQLLLLNLTKYMKNKLKWMLLFPVLCIQLLGLEDIDDKITLGNYSTNSFYDYINIPNVSFSFNNVALEEVVNILAKASGINYQIEASGLPLISTQMRMNPFKALNLLVENNGLYMLNKDNLWFIRKTDEANVYSVNYSLSNIHLSSMQNKIKSSVDKESEEKNLTHDNLNNEDDSSKITDENHNLIVKNIEQILLLDKEKNNKSLVSYDPDSNGLYVIANKKQHQMIDAYLEQIDQDIPNVEMKIMFLASNENPDAQFGVDWSGVLGDGYRLNVSGFDASGKKTDIKFGSIDNLINPSTAILSTDIFSLKLRGLESNTGTKTKRYPTTTGYSNREVMINFTKNEPIISTKSDTQVQTSANNIGSGTTSTVEVQQEQVGTIVRLIPRVIEGNRVSMDIDIGVSNILGFKTLNGNDYPIISQTRYQGQTIVESGYTLVIGGLEETITEDTAHGVKFLKDIPFFGWLFKDVKYSDKKQKLSLYISVRLINSKGQAIKPKELLDKKKIEEPLIRLNKVVKKIEQDLKSS